MEQAAHVMSTRGGSRSLDRGTLELSGLNLSVLGRG